MQSPMFIIRTFLLFTARLIHGMLARAIRLLLLLHAAAAAASASADTSNMLSD